MQLSYLRDFDFFTCQALSNMFDLKWWIIPCLLSQELALENQYFVTSTASSKKPRGKTKREERRETSQFPINLAIRCDLCTSYMFNMFALATCPSAFHATIKWNTPAGSLWFTRFHAFVPFNIELKSTVWANKTIYQSNAHLQWPLRIVYFQLWAEW